MPEPRELIDTLPAILHSRDMDRIIGRAKRLADALEAALERETDVARYWRGLLADTAIGLRGQNVSREQIAGAIERALDAARNLDALAARPADEQAAAERGEA